MPDNRTLIMGILNLTPDSFYDGGIHNSVADALNHTEKMLSEGADIIDVGGESTRPGSGSVSEKEELERVVPVIKEIVHRFNCMVSVDTTKTEVARQALDAGAVMVNDISGLVFEPAIAKYAAEYDAQIVLSHTSSRPSDMQKKTQYTDVAAEVCDYLRKSVNIAEQSGIKPENIIVDPGIGFGKTVQHNLLLLKHLDRLKILGKRILTGTSMKSFIGKILRTDDISLRSDGTFATVVISILNGADMVRVHDVAKMRNAVTMADSIKYMPDY